MVFIRNTLGASTEADFARLAQLRKMQGIALALLAVMAVIFAVTFALQDRFHWLTFVRAAAEGGMVGGLADWFAITALFRRPLKLPVPHTNLVSVKKDEIGEGLGAFIEENFLADDVIHDKLSEINGARMAGEWVSKPRNAAKVDDLLANAALASLTVLDDSDVQELLEGLARKHLVEAQWAPAIGRVGQQFVADGYQSTIIDLATDHLENWLMDHPEAFQRFVTRRVPSWMPGFANRFLDSRLHSEALRFIRDVRDNSDHPFRHTVDEFLNDFMLDLQNNSELQQQVEDLGREVFDSPRIRSLAEGVWSRIRELLVDQLEEPESEIRQRIRGVLCDFGTRLQNDPTLQFKIDVWVMKTVEHLVHSYRHELAGVVSDTVRSWDAQEAAQKIELQVGKDLQFIRINGTIVGSLAGLLITAIAHLATALA
jgi:uncharacterized membrane-anchored protein YjiN (DUF445 family)